MLPKGLETLLCLIVFELGDGSPAARREEIEARITATGAPYVKPTSGSWLVDSDDNVDSWAGRLSPPVGDSDRLLIVRIAHRANGWLEDEEWEWINERTSAIS
jgi:hypothetical protein